MGSVTPMDSRLATRARIRRDARVDRGCAAHGLSDCFVCRTALRAWDAPDDRARRAEGQIPARYVPDGDWMDGIEAWTKFVERAFCFLVCAGALIGGVILGKALVSAIWG